MKRKGLATKILIIFIVAMATVTAISYVSALYLLGHNIILKETLGRINAVAQNEVAAINNHRENEKNVLEGVAIGVRAATNDEQIFEVLKESANIFEDIDSAYIGREDNNNIFGDGTEASPDYYAPERPWYLLAKSANGEVIITEPYRDFYTNNLFVTVAQHLGMVNGVDTVIAMDLYVDSVTELVSQANIIDGGYAFLVNKEGYIIVHPDDRFMPKSETGFFVYDEPAYKAAIEALNTDKNVRLRDYDGNLKYFMGHTIESVGWRLYVVAPDSAIYEEMNNGMFFMILANTLVALAALVAVSMQLKRSVVKPINNLISVATSLSEGDTSNIYTSNSRDEIGALCNDVAKASGIINSMVHDIEKMVDIHTEGNYRYKLDSSKYNGSYRELMESVNKMTFMYVDDFSELLRMLGKLGDGDFEANVRNYPGERSGGNAIINGLRSNLKNINVEINLLAEAALRGELSARTDIAKFKGDWVNIFDSLNYMMETISKPIAEAALVLGELSQGNLKMKMTGDYKGEFSLIKEAMNVTIDELSSYIKEITEVLEKVASNDLTAHMKREYLGDFVAIKDSIEKIINNLNDVVAEIFVVSEQVTRGAKRSSDNNSLLATGTAEQSETIEVLTKSINEINTQMLESAKDAQTVDSLSKTSMENAQNGNKEMQNMLDSIEGIKDASINIAKIMKVIDEIAFQTNLLALNAAVEAARAGQYGKGFAVVAEEVRSLAARSQGAAKETQRFIEDALDRINSGVGIASSTSDALSKIVENVAEVSGLISRISKSSSEQSESVANVAVGINQISRVVQNNSSISLETASAAEELLAQADTLQSALSVFKIGKR